jgi:hypothetical protein
MSDNMRAHIGDPNSDTVQFFVPGGNRNFNTFGIYAPEIIPDFSGPTNLLGSNNGLNPTILSSPLDTPTPSAYGLGCPVDPLLPPPPPSI